MPIYVVGSNIKLEIKTKFDHIRCNKELVTTTNTYHAYYYILAVY